jgi:hypothetical protein
MAHIDHRADHNSVFDLPRQDLCDTYMISDKDGTAIIMCQAELSQKYRQMTRGETVLESSLHLNLAEHLNSEIVLGTVTSLKTAM